MTRYIEAHRATFGVEPICRTLAIAPSSYYAAKVPTSAYTACASCGGRSVARAARSVVIGPAG